jgi:4-hydroxythreonine-4-phosphate dehydrogenase
MRSIEQAVDYGLQGQIDGLVTAPIQKESMQAGGFDFPGHTEYLAHLCGTSEPPLMMLAAKDLRVVPQTIHVSLKNVPSLLTTEKIVQNLKTLDRALRQDFGIAKPHIAVCGLNPHAGESGMIGREEIDIIAPAIRTACEAGLNLSGPHSADTLFHEAARRHYDAALCMYHDQALIPVKTLDFYGGVNITLNLPVVRTSPDHGTALNLAGKGIACADSLINALKTANDIARARKK